MAKKQLTKEDMMNPEILDTLSQEEIMDNLLRLKLIEPDKDFNKGGAVKKKKKPKDAIGVMVAIGKVKKGRPQMSYGGSIGSKKHNYAGGGSVTNNLKKRR